MKLAETRTLAALFTLEIVIPDPVQQCGGAPVVKLPAFRVLLKVSISMLVRRG